MTKNCARARSGFATQGDLSVDIPDRSVLSWIWEWRVPTTAKIGVSMHVSYDVTSLIFPKHPPPSLFILLTDDDESCYSIEQVFGKDKVSGTSI